MPDTHPWPITAQVFLNMSRDDMFNGFTPNSALVAAGDVKVAVSNPTSAECVLEAVYAAANCGSGVEYPPYFNRGNRSLSVADVVAIDGVTYAVARVGFERVTVRPEQVSA